jgi:hypothetical protein
VTRAGLPRTPAPHAVMSVRLPVKRVRAGAALATLALVATATAFAAGRLPRRRAWPIGLAGRGAARVRGPPRALVLS